MLDDILEAVDIDRGTGCCTGDRGGRSAWVLALNRRVLRLIITVIWAMTLREHDSSTFLGRVWCGIIGCAKRRHRRRCNPVRSIAELLGRDLCGIVRMRSLNTVSDCFIMVVWQGINGSCVKPWQTFAKTFDPTASPLCKVDYHTPQLNHLTIK